MRERSIPNKKLVRKSKRNIYKLNSHVEFSNKKTTNFKFFSKTSTSNFSESQKFYETLDAFIQPFQKVMFPIENTAISFELLMSKVPR